MGRLAQLTGERLVRALVRLGWTVDRQSGSHVILTFARRNPVSVPVHRGKTLKEGTARGILKCAGVSEQSRLLRSVSLQLDGFIKPKEFPRLGDDVDTRHALEVLTYMAAAADTSGIARSPGVRPTYQRISGGRQPDRFVRELARQR